MSVQIFVYSTARICITYDFIRISIINGMPHSGKERKSIPLPTYIKLLSACDIITAVHLEVLRRRVEFVLKSPHIRARFRPIGKSQQIHSIRLEEIGGKGLCIHTGRYTGANVTVTYQFFGRDINICAPYIASVPGSKCFVDSYGLYKVGSEKIKRDILVFRVFRRHRETIERSSIIAVTQSTYEYVLHTVLLGNSGDFRHSSFRIRNSFA